MNTIISIIGSYTLLSTLLFAGIENLDASWGKYGILGLVLFAVFYWGLRPMVKHLTENQVKTQERLTDAIIDLIKSQDSITQVLNKISEDLRETKLKTSMEHESLKKNLERLQQDINNIKNK